MERILDGGGGHDGCGKVKVCCSSLQRSGLNSGLCTHRNVGYVVAAEVITHCVKLCCEALSENVLMDASIKSLTLNRTVSQENKNKSEKIRLCVCMIHVCVHVSTSVYVCGHVSFYVC